MPSLGTLLRPAICVRSRMVAIAAIPSCDYVVAEINDNVLDVRISPRAKRGVFKSVRTEIVFVRVCVRAWVCTLFAFAVLTTFFAKTLFQN